MIQGSQKNTEDLIVEFLAGGGFSGKAITNHVNTFKKISKQSIYERLRNLLDQKILLKVRAKYFLNNAWVDDIRQMFGSFGSPSLKEGESIFYTFSDLYKLNDYWKHLFYKYSSLDSYAPVFSYDKHPFWEHLDSEDANKEKYERLFLEDKQTVFFLIGSESKMDREFKLRNQSKFYRINCINNTSLNERDFLMVFGDIVVTTRVPKEFIIKVKDLYSSDISLLDLRAGIRKIISSATKTTLKIECNHQKAIKLQKLVIKDFVV